MPNRMNNFYFGDPNLMWVKFDKSFVSPTQKRIYYKFKCWVKPMICQSNNRISNVILSDEYYITKFEITSSPNGSLECITLSKNEHHPHKHPKTSRLCIGRFKGEPVNKHLMLKVIFFLLIKYNEDDCYCVPDFCKKLTEDNQCQTS
jgi:hypothetical protein